MSVGVNVMLSLMSVISPPPDLCGLSARTVVYVGTLGVLDLEVSSVQKSTAYTWLDCCCFNAAQIVLTPPAPRNGGPFLPWRKSALPSKIEDQIVKQTLEAAEAGFGIS